ERGLHLRTRVRDDVEARVRRGAVHVTGMREEVRRAPEQLHARRFLALCRLLDHRCEALLALRHALPFRREIPVVEAVERHAKLREELERGVEAVLGALERIAPLVPRIASRTGTEWIRAGAVK